MNIMPGKYGVWFVYDGECPLCTKAALALRIKERHGSLHLLDARTSQDPLIDEINRRGFDLDDGMVIFSSGQFYHGKSALEFMAAYGEASNGFTAICKSLFWSDRLSALTYPWMRGVRNRLLRMKNISPLDNLGKKSAPIFKDVFGSSWDDLPPVFKKHYANRPYTNDVVIAEGTLDVFCGPPLKWIGPIMRLIGQIPARNEKNVPVTVRFESDPNSKAFRFNRHFHFRESSAYRFQSKMLQIRDNQIIEIMKFGLGWKMLYKWDGRKVVLEHDGYGFNLLGHIIPLPLEFLLGRGYAEEIAIDENTFDMMTSITHSIWGKIYEYKGRFTIAG